MKLQLNKRIEKIIAENLSNKMDAIFNGDATKHLAGYEIKQAFTKRAVELALEIIRENPVYADMLKEKVEKAVKSFLEIKNE